MNATTLIGHGRIARNVSVKMTITGALASAALLASLNPTAVGFPGRLPLEIGGTTESLAMSQSVDGGSVVARAGTAGDATATGNAYGGVMLAAGTSNTQTLRFTNTGRTAVTALTGTAAVCSQQRMAEGAGAASDLCDKVRIHIASGGATAFDGTAAAFGHAGAVDILGPAGRGAVPPGETVDLTITITLSPDMDNRYQGLQIDQPITWRFGA